MNAPGITQKIREQGYVQGGSGVQGVWNRQV